MTEVYGNPLVAWITAFGVFAIAWTGLGLLRRILRKRVAALAKRHLVAGVAVALHTIGETRSWFLLLVALYTGTLALDLPGAAEIWIDRIVLIGTLLQTGLWATAAIVRLLDLRRERELRDNPAIVAAMDMLGFAARLVVWSVVLLVLLDNLGIEITTLVAGLGIGGIAIALAAQNVLGDLFASLSIVLDKPFVVGDFLAIGDFLGSVEKVGIKTTRIRSLSGEQLIFPNNDLLGSRIRNYGRMQERRVVFTIGITYETPAGKLARVAELLREAVEAERSLRFDRAHFQGFGDFALIYEVVFFVTSADYNRYMDLQQAVNIGIFERFAAEGIDFAYPTQTLRIAMPAATGGARRDGRDEQGTALIAS